MSADKHFLHLHPDDTTSFTTGSARPRPINAAPLHRSSPTLPEFLLRADIGIAAYLCVPGVPAPSADQLVAVECDE